MEDKNKQFKNSILYLSPVIIGNLLPFITLPIFTRILTPVDYGVLALARIYSIVVSGLAGFGLAAIFERNYFQHKEVASREALLATLTNFVLLFSGVLILITFFTQEFFSNLIIRSPEYGHILFWSLVTYCLIEVKQFYSFYFRNSENAKDFVRFVLAESFLLMVFSLILVAGLRIGVMGLVWGQLLSVLVILVALKIKFSMHRKLHIHTKELLENMKLSFPLIPRIFVKTIGTQFDKYMIGLLASIGLAGVYGIGQKVSMLVFSFMDGIAGVFRPRVYYKMFNSGEKGGQEIGVYLTPFFYFVSLFGLLLILFCEEVFMILTPPEYHGAIPITIILAMFYLPMFFRMQPQLLYAKKTFMITTLSTFSIVINILVNIPFIKLWGAIGAAWATLLTGMISTVLEFIIYQKYYRIHWEYKKIVPIFSFFMGTGIIMVFLNANVSGYFPKLGLKIILLSLFLGWGMWLKILTLENWRFIKSFIKSALSKRTSRA